MKKILLLLLLLAVGCGGNKAECDAYKAYLGPGEYESCLEWCGYEDKWVAYVGVEYEGVKTTYYCTCTNSGKKEIELNEAFYRELLYRRRNEAPPCKEKK